MLRDWTRLRRTPLVYSFLKPHGQKGSVTDERSFKRLIGVISTERLHGRVRFEKP